MTKERIISLDVLRGITIMLMILVNNPGSWDHIFTPLAHAPWHGCTFADLVFPFFIFIMGAAIPMAMPQETLGKDSFVKIAARSLRIICLGIFLCFFYKIKIFGLEGMPLFLVKIGITIGVAYALLGNFANRTKLIVALAIFTLFMVLAFGGFEDYKEVRLLGVLQRIGIVYFFASILYLTSTTRMQIIVSGFLLFVYWGILTLIPVPGFGEANIEMGTNLGAYIDSLLINGHLWEETVTWDPEGFLSTIPSIVTGLTGVLLGKIVCDLSISKKDKIKKILIIGAIMAGAGLVWSFVFPLNKSLWTSSYVLFTAGLASLLLAIFYYFIDVLGYKKWATPFLYWGVNPMFVFFFSYMLPDEIPMMTSGNVEEIKVKDYLFNNHLINLFTDPNIPSLLWALMNVAIWFVVLWLFYRKKWFFKV